MSTQTTTSAELMEQLLEAKVDGDNEEELILAHERKQARIRKTIKEERTLKYQIGELIREKKIEDGGSSFIWTASNSVKELAEHFEPYTFSEDELDLFRDELKDLIDAKLLENFNGQQQTWRVVLRVLYKDDWETMVIHNLFPEEIGTK